MFPDEKTPAPKAERKAPVSLNQLLSPHPESAAPASSSSASGSSRPSSGFVPPSWGSSQAPMDPAMLAAMMVQAAMMKSSSPAPPMMATMPYAGQIPPVCFRPPFGQVPGTGPYSSTPQLASDAAEVSTPASVKVSGLGESLPPMRPPKPSIQAQRISNIHSITSREKGSEVTPFVMLLEGFCERMLSDGR